MTSSNRVPRNKPRPTPVEPEQQRKLRSAIEQAFGDEVTFLAPHAWELGLTIGVHPARVRDVFQRLRDDSAFLFGMLVDVTAVDWLDQREPRFDVVYQLLSLTFLHRLCVKVAVPEEKPEVQSLEPLWKSANYMERELWDMYGIRTLGHPDLRRILLYDEFEGFPLRKDYPLRGKQPRVPLRIPEIRNSSDDLRREELVSLPRRRESIV